MSAARVRVIIPTFNRRLFLGRAIDSVIIQTFKNWELVIVDDGSTDETADFLDHIQKTWKYPQSLQVIQTPNKGVSAARNLGAMNAKTPWLAFLDSDDEWLPQKLELQMALSEFTETPLIHGEEIWIRNGVRVNPKLKYKKSGGEIFERCVDHCCISISTSLVRRDLFSELRGFREDFKVCEDYELWLRITAHFAVGFIEAPVAIKYGGHADQLSTQFHSMDYDRVRALMPFLRSQTAFHLSEKHRKYIASNVIQRIGILETGLRKRLALGADRPMQMQVELESWKNLANTI